PIKIPRRDTNQSLDIVVCCVRFLKHSENVKLAVIRTRAIAAVVRRTLDDVAVVFPPRGRPVPGMKRHVARERVPLVLERGETVPSCDVLDVHDPLRAIWEKKREAT